MDVSGTHLQEFVSGIGFAEGLRWHRNALWASDIVQRRVMRVDADGRVETVLSTPGEPSGLGWLPDGSLLVVQMDEHELWRWDGARFSRYCATAPVSRAKLNDLAVDGHGRAWVSNLGFDYETENPRPTALVAVAQDRRVAVAAEDLWCPNGLAISPTGDRLYVGQSASSEVLEFTITAAGELVERRVFGRLPEAAFSDGICLDSEGALWIASPTTREFLRMQRGGRIIHRVSTGDRHAIACVLGGRDRRTLYCATSATLSLARARQECLGRIEAIEVDVPGAGFP